MATQIEPYKTGLSQANAYWMARLSQLVYESVDASNAPNESAILNELQAEDSKFESVTGFSRNTAQAALVEHEDYLCFAFRGTDEPKDWLDNINAFSTAELFGEFHRGFWNSVEDIWQGLFRLYQDKRNEQPRPLFLTGHSLGGAMATVAASRLIHNDLPFTSTYTFGQPRAMTLATARVFNIEARGRTHRFQNNNDIVTRVPARFMGYSHVGNFIYIDENKRLKDDPGFWNRFLDTVQGAVDALRETGVDAVEDHDIGRYLRAVEKWDWSD